MNDNEDALLVGTIRLMVSQGWDNDECAKALVEDFDLTDEQARTALAQARRQRDELDITDAHDEIMEDHHR